MDGQDYDYREKVASQYQARAVLKSQLTFMLQFSVIPWILLLLHIFNLPIFLMLLGINMDGGDAQHWQPAYTLSIVPVLFGLMSMKRNSVVLMNVSVLTTLTCSVSPLLWAVFNVSQEIRKSNLKMLLLIMPLCVFHLFTAYKSHMLTSSWQKAKKK